MGYSFVLYKHGPYSFDLKWIRRDSWDAVC